VGKSSLLRPLEEEEDTEEEEEEEVVSRAASSSTSKMGGMFSVFRGLVGNKALTKVRYKYWYLTTVPYLPNYRTYCITTYLPYRPVPTVFGR